MGSLQPQDGYINFKDTDFSDGNECFKAALAELKRIGKGSVDHLSVINELYRPETVSESTNTVSIMEECGNRSL